MVAGNAQAVEHRIGGGANYWTSVDDIDLDKIDDDGFSFLASYQFWPGLIGLELDLEIVPDQYGETAYAPQAYALIGKAIYAGAGIGINYRDGDLADEPFFSLRAGLNLEVLPGIYWDIYGNYRFNDTTDLEDHSTDIDSDTIFLGSAVRIAI
ncbi:hypothetical protein VT98_10042 [Candidatus Electrothrix communis]|uniref:Outer membrane protein beta-barrel domain-containing protein n=1 Tax=Candidatus Electrothrix communis TaxID=1859133 RepID=A0A3S3QWV3_9BACT|nr:hypothetical protein VT98_10042 [Candidatus Electrothrix communis]